METNDVIKDPDLGAGSSPSSEVKVDNEQVVPYYRFKEVNEKYKNTETQLESLKAELQQLKSSKPEEDEQEPATWKEAEGRAAKRAVMEMKAEQLAERQKQEEIERNIDRGIDQLKALGHKITPEVQQEIYEELVRTGNSVHDAYISIRTRNQKKDTADQIKVEGALPDSKGAEAKASAITYKELHRLSMDQLIARAQNAKK